MPEDDLQDFDYITYAIGGTIYVFGAMLYALKFPERYFPGVFDYLGNSHNIFHTCCVIGAGMHWYACVKTFHQRTLNPCKA